MDNISRIQSDIIGHSWRETFCKFFHLSFHSFWNIQRIGPRLLVNSNSSRRFSIQSRHYTVWSRPQINACNIFQTKHRPVLLTADNNIPELFRRFQSSLNIQRILKSIIIILSDRLTDISGRYFHILRLDRLIDLLRWNIPYTHSLRIEPDAHRIVPCSHHIHSTHSGHTCQLVH